MEILYVEQNGVRQAIYLADHRRRPERNREVSLFSNDDDQYLLEEVPQEEWLTVWEARPHILHRWRCG